MSEIAKTQGKTSRAICQVAFASDVFYEEMQTSKKASRWVQKADTKASKRRMKNKTIEPYLEE